MFQHFYLRNVWSSRDRTHPLQLPQRQPPPPQPALPALPAPQRPWARGRASSRPEPRWSWPPNSAPRFPFSRTKTSISLSLPGSSRVRPTTAQVSRAKDEEGFEFCPAHLNTQTRLESFESHPSRSVTDGQIKVFFFLFFCGFPFLKSSFERHRFVNHRHSFLPLFFFCVSDFYIW